MNIKLKISRFVNLRIFCFIVSFSFYYLSMFVRDIEQTTMDFDLVASYLRIISYFFITVAIVAVPKTKKQLMIFGLFLLVGVLLLIRSRVFFFAIMAMLVLISNDVEWRTILKVSFLLLLSATMVVLIMCQLGVLKNLNTERWANEIATRNTYGFYHSNVLPLIFLYLVSYIVLLKNKTLKFIDYLILGAINIFLYAACDSRNAFIFTNFILISSMLLKRKKMMRELYKCLFIYSKYSAFVCSLFSIIGTIFLKKSTFLSKIDYLISFRFTYSYKKMQSLGLSLFPKLNTESFFSDHVVIDNGYMFIAYRYGLIVLLLLCLMCYIGAKKIENNQHATIILIALTTVNFFDNDLFDYSCMPFILIFMNNSLVVMKNFRKKQVNKTYNLEKGINI